MFKCVLGPSADGHRFRLLMDRLQIGALSCHIIPPGRLICVFKGCGLPRAWLIALHILEYWRVVRKYSFANSDFSLQELQYLDWRRQ